jgi:hypothetical protein
LNVLLNPFPFFKLFQIPMLPFNVIQRHDRGHKDREVVLLHIEPITPIFLYTESLVANLCFRIIAAMLAMPTVGAMVVHRPLVTVDTGTANPIDASLAGLHDNVVCFFVFSFRIAFGENRAFDGHVFCPFRINSVMESTDFEELGEALE